MVKQTVDNDIHSQVLDVVDHCLTLFQKATGVSVPRPEIGYDLIGTSAGVAYGHRKIELNKILFINNLEDFIKQTIPHEVAHICASYYYTLIVKRSIRAHGTEWKAIMRIFNVEEKRCHNYDVTQVASKRDITKHLYTCNCNLNHLLTPRRAKNAHNLMCNKCHSDLKFVASGKMTELQKYIKKAS